MTYPYGKLNVDNPERYYYADHNIEEDWKSNRAMVKMCIKSDFDKLVKEFETAKTYRDVDLIEMAKVFCTAYEKFGELIYLNSFLKCIDMLCSTKDNLDIMEKMKLCRLIDKEKDFIEKLKG